MAVEHLVASVRPEPGGFVLDLRGLRLLRALRRDLRDHPPLGLRGHLPGRRERFERGVRLLGIAAIRVGYRRLISDAPSRGELRGDGQRQGEHHRRQGRVHRVRRGRAHASLHPRLAYSHSRMPRLVGWVAKSKWPILQPAHPCEKSAAGFVETSIHRLPSL
jgi:hypothetical protein